MSIAKRIREQKLESSLFVTEETISSCSDGVYIRFRLDGKLSSYGKIDKFGSVC